MKAKSIELVAELMSSSEVPMFAKEKLMQIMRIETMAVKLGGFRMTDYISKDTSRPVFTGVYYDESGYEVATNCHILVYRKANIPDDLKNKVVLPNGELLSEREYNLYPNWKAVIPKKSKDTIDCTIDVTRVEEFAKDWKAIKKITDKKIAVVKFCDNYFKLDLLVLFCKALKFAQVCDCYIHKRYSDCTLCFGDLESMGGILISMFKGESEDFQIYEM